MALFIVALFTRPLDSREAFDDLARNGVPSERMTILGPEEAPENSTRNAEGATEKGVAIGGATGLLAGLVSLTLPGMAPLMGIGPAVAAVAGGTAVGALTGGLAGLLSDAGVTEEQAVPFSEGLERGGSLLIAPVDPTTLLMRRDLVEQHGPAEIGVFPSEELPSDMAASRRMSPAVGE